MSCSYDNCSGFPAISVSDHTGPYFDISILLFMTLCSQGGGSSAAAEPTEGIETICSSSIARKREGQGANFCV